MLISFTFFILCLRILIEKKIKNSHTHFKRISKLQNNDFNLFQLFYKHWIYSGTI